MRSAFVKPRRSRAKALRPERAIQTAVFDYARVREQQEPRWGLVYAVPNGGGLRHQVQRTASGKNVRFSIEGKALKREGMTEGMPDVNVDVRTLKYAALRIEHKAPGKYPTPMQRYRMALLTREGFLCLVSREADHTIAAIEAYLRMEEERSNGYDPFRFPPLRELVFEPKPADFTKPAPKPRRVRA